ncbi:MAG: diguanylate cyclase [Chitinivibrionales bacterium]|nr:diguanylate cyclase [Chitinivibrionales bacterium]MBD3395678.1 diguanylate cyclase [Chitinivibrionales bacterium]
MMQLSRLLGHVWVPVGLCGACLLSYYAGGGVAAAGVPLSIVMLTGWLLWLAPWASARDDTGDEESHASGEPPLLRHAQRDVDDEVSDVPLSVLGTAYRRRELEAIEQVVDAILDKCITLIRARLTGHTIAILFPTADGGYRIRRYASASDHINEDAVIYPGVGVIGSFLKDGLKQLKLEDIVTDSMTLYYYRKDAGIRSLMASPIVVGGVERGTIIVDSTEKKHFTDEDHAFLSTMAEVCGQAVYYAYLYNEHKLDHTRLMAMSSTEKYFFQNHDIDAVFDRMAEIIPFAFPCARMTISLKDPEANVAHIKRAWGTDAGAFADMEFALDGKTLAGILYAKNLCFYRNFSTDRYEIRYHEKEPRTRGLGSFLAFPIGVEECKGLILLESQGKDAFGHSSRDLLSRLVTSAGVAIEKIQILKQTESMATHDGLTGLYNHRQFQLLLKEAITRSIRYKDPLALVICDIDYFKRVNDTYGHRFGDSVLVEIAGRLGKSIREGIDVAARYGGEEFALILEKTDADRALETTERIRQGLERATFQTPHGKEITISMSFGIAVYGKHARTQESLIQRADKALYAAKTNGRNRSELYLSGDTELHVPRVSGGTTAAAPRRKGTARS